MALTFLLLLYAHLLGLASALSKEGWRSQSIYQLLTDRYARTDGSTDACSDLGQYCGGTWQGIINNLDYIQDMGFTAIWISPITENIQGDTHYGAAFHGFWPQKINQVNANFGTGADLQALSSALHQRGMYLMIDMVTNDMAWNGNSSTVDYSIYDVFDDESYYHPFCQVTDYQNVTQTTQCWTGDEYLELPDLATEQSVVTDKWTSWVSNITAFYGVDGIRLDSCNEQEKPFLTPFESAAGVYIICEIYNNPPDSVCDYQNYVSGLLNFPIWFLVVAAFESNSGSMSDLYSGITQVQGNCTDVTLLGNFVENHDQPRLPYSTTDSGLDQCAIAFVMMNDGIPIVYAGEEQHYSGGAPPADRETTWTSNYDTTNVYYTLIKQINLFRKCVMAKDPTWLTALSVPFYLDTQVIAMKKGSNPATHTVGVYNNRGTQAEAYTIDMADTGWTAGDQIHEIYTDQTVTMNVDGTLPVYMYGGQPRIYYLLSSQCFGNGSTSSPPIVQTTSVTLATTPSSTLGSSTPPEPLSSTSVPTSSMLGSSTPPESLSSTSAPPSSTLGSSTPTALSSSTYPAPSSSTSLATSSSAPPTPPSSTPLAPPSSVTGFPTDLPSSSGQIASSDTLTSNIISPAGAISSSTSYIVASSDTSIADSSSVTLLQSTSGGNPLGSPTPASTVLPGASVPGTSSPSSGNYLISPAISSAGTPAPASLSPTVPPSTAPTPATTPPVCPSANGGTFTSNEQMYVVGCGVGSDQEYFAQHTGSDIADCVRICTAYTGTQACEAVTFIDGVCYLKPEPGAVHIQDGSDSAFVISAPAGVASGSLSGNISQAAPTCPGGNGNTFESKGYFYVVGCNIDDYVVDIFASPGADLATCVESCIMFAGTTSCAAVTYKNGNCHLKGSVGTVFHASDTDTAFIIVRPPPSGPGSQNGTLPSGPSLPGPGLPNSSPSPPLGSGLSNGLPPLGPGFPNSPPPAGSPSLQPNPVGTYTVVSPGKVVVYIPNDDTCPG